MRYAPALRNEGLPFADILTEASIRDVLNEHGVQFRDRVFNPVTTIWGFLSQVLSEDHSCRDAVSRIIAHRAANGIAVCSPNTASYCNARSRILTSVLSTLARRTAEELQTSVGDQWKWNGRSVFIVDGSSVSMPDTPENQQMYPQPPQQAKGLGFPLARIGLLLSLATGACHDWVFRRSIAWLSDTLSTLRSADYSNTTQDSLPVAGQALLARAFHPQGSAERFPSCGLHLIPLSQAWLGAIDVTQCVS